MTLLKIFLTLVSNGLMLYVFWGIFQAIRRGATKPNAAMWLMLAILMLANSLTYVPSSSDYLQSSISVIVTICIVAIFTYTCQTGLFRWKDLSWIDIACVLSIIPIGICWYYSDAKTANALLQLSIFISFFPTFRGLVWGKGREYPLPWFAAVAAYSISTVNALIGYENIVQLIYPIVNGIIGNGVVAIAAIQKERRIFCQEYQKNCLMTLEASYHCFSAHNAHYTRRK